MRLSKSAHRIILAIFVSVTAFPALSKPYEYSIKRGTAAWRALSGPYERWAACNIPEDVLASMTAKDIVETFVAYPLAAEMFMSNESWDDGFDRIVGRFSGAREVLKRPECAGILAEKYVTMCQQAKTKRQPPDFCQSAFICSALRRDEVFSRLLPQTRNQLAEAAIIHIGLQEKGYADRAVPGRLLADLIVRGGVRFAHVQTVPD